MKNAKTIRIAIVSERMMMLAAFMVLMALFPELVMAQDGGTTSPGLPFESNLKMLSDSMTGPIPTILSIVGIVGCGGMLIFGGEISGFARTMVFLVLVISVIVQSGAIVKALGGKGLALSVITWPIG